MSSAETPRAVAKLVRKFWMMEFCRKVVKLSLISYVKPTVNMPAQRELISCMPSAQEVHLSGCVTQVRQLELQAMHWSLSTASSMPVLIERISRTKPDEQPVHEVELEQTVQAAGQAVHVPLFSQKPYAHATQEVGERQDAQLFWQRVQLPFDSLSVPRGQKSQLGLQEVSGLQTPAVRMLPGSQRVQVAPLHSEQGGVHFLAQMIDPAALAFSSKPTSHVVQAPFAQEVQPMGQRTQRLLANWNPLEQLRHVTTLRGSHSPVHELRHLTHVPSAFNANPRAHCWQMETFWAQLTQPVAHWLMQVALTRVRPNLQLVQVVRLVALAHSLQPPWQVTQAPPLSKKNGMQTVQTEAEEHVRHPGLQG